MDGDNTSAGIEPTPDLSTSAVAAGASNGATPSSSLQAEAVLDKAVTVEPVAPDEDNASLSSDALPPPPCMEQTSTADPDAEKTPALA